MIELFVCGYNIFCHFNNISNNMNENKYSKDVAQMCIYFERQKEKLPEYCFYKSTANLPRHRNEY